MNKEKITISEIVESMAPKNNFSKKQTEEFVKTLLSTIEDVLIEGEIIKIKDFGTFKPQWNEPRKSVDVNTGEEIIVPGYYKVVFAPDNVLKEQVNKPYSHLQPVEQSTDQKPPVLSSKNTETNVEAQEIEEDTPENKSTQENSKATHEPMRAFEEQAAQIKGLLSEIIGVSGRRKQPVVKEDLPVEIKAEPVISTPVQEKPEEIAEVKPSISKIEEKDDEAVKTIIPEEKEDFKSDYYEAGDAETKNTDAEKNLYDDRISRKQRKKLEREEQKQRRREEIKRYFDDNQFNVVREIHPEADNSTHSEAETIHYFDEEIFSIVGFEDTIQESAQAQAEQKDEAETKKTNNGIETISDIASQETPIEEFVQEDEAETEEIIDLHEDNDIQEEPKIGNAGNAQEPLNTASVGTESIENQEITSEAIQNQQITTEDIKPQELNNNPSVEIQQPEVANTVVEPVKIVEKTEEAELANETIAIPKTNPVIQTGSQEEDFDYTFTPVRKRRRRWWLFVLLPLILIALAFGIWFYLPQIKPYIKPYIERIIPQQKKDSAAVKTVVIPKKVVVDTTAVNPNDTANFNEVFNKERDYKEFIGSEVTTSAKDIKRIAKDRYGNDAFWIYIYEANNEVIEDPKNIPVGTPVNIPKLDPRLINVNNPECIKKAKKLADDYLKN